MGRRPEGWGESGSGVGAAAVRCTAGLCTAVGNYCANDEINGTLDWEQGLNARRDDLHGWHGKGCGGRGVEHGLKRGERWIGR